MDNLQSYGFTAMLAKIGLTGISGAATTHSTGATTVNYAIRGKAYQKAQISGGTTPTTDSATAAAITLVKNQARVVVWALDSAGTVKVYAGPVVSLDANTGDYLSMPQFPAIPDTVCPFAYTVHKAGSTLVGTFTFGTSNWNTTGLTHTVVDCAVLPDRPQNS